MKDLKMIRTPLILMILAVLFYVLGLERGFTQSTTESLHFYMAKFTASALSNLFFDLKGFIGYESLFKLLLDHQVIDDSILQKAVSLQNFDGQSVFKISAVDLGYILFAKYSFLLFGVKVSSLFMGFLFLLTTSALIFWYHFRTYRYIDATIVLIYTSLLIVSFKAPNMPYNVGVPFSVRFMSLIGIIPLLHLLLFLVLNLNFKSKTESSKPYSKKFLLLSAAFIFIQTAILFLGIITRSSLQWAILAILPFIPVVLWKYFWKKENSFPLLIIISIFFSLFSLKGIFELSKDKSYKADKDGKHVFWHSLYLGLAMHPTIRNHYSPVLTDESTSTPKSFLEMSKYKPNDQDGYTATMHYLYKNGLNEFEIMNFSPNEKVQYKNIFYYFKNKNHGHDRAEDFSRKIDMEKDYRWNKTEDILKTIVIDIIKNHPIEALISLLVIKPLTFSFVLYNHVFRVEHFLNFETLILILMIFLFSFLYRNETMSIHNYCSVLIFSGYVGIFSLIAPILIYSEPWTIADQMGLVVSIISIGLFALMQKIFSLSFRQFLR